MWGGIRSSFALLAAGVLIGNMGNTNVPLTCSASEPDIHPTSPLQHHQQRQLDELQLMVKHLPVRLAVSTEVQGLRPMEVMGKQLSGLDSNLVHASLRGKKIVLVGDSTTQHLAKVLCRLLVDSSNATLDMLSTTNVTDAYTLVGRGNDYDDPDHATHCTDEHGTMVHWLGISGPGSHSCQTGVYAV